MSCCTNCCSNCARFFIGIASIAVLICAVVAAAIVFKNQDDADWSSISTKNLPFVFILVAMALAVVTSVIGLIMICCKKQCLNITYLVLLIIVILFEVAVIVLAFVYSDDILNSIEDHWLDDSVNSTRRIFEEQFNCCGFNDTMLVLEQLGGVCGSKTATVNCYKAIEDSVNKNMKQLQIAIIVMCVVEIILLISAIYLVCSSKSQVSGIQYG